MVTCRTREERTGLLARIRTRSRLDHSVLLDESELAPNEVAVGSMLEIEDENGHRIELEISSVSGSETISQTRRAAGRRSGTATETPSTWMPQAARGRRESCPFGRTCNP